MVNGATDAPVRRSFRAGCRCITYARDGSREGEVSGHNVPLRNPIRHQVATRQQRFML